MSAALPGGGEGPDGDLEDLLAEESMPWLIADLLEDEETKDLAAAAAAVEEAEEAERQQVELELVALTARSQQLRARLRGTTRVTPAPPPPFNHGAEGAPEGAPLCAVCQGAPSDLILVPCGHQRACMSCAAKAVNTVSKRAKAHAARHLPTPPPRRS